MGHNNNTLSEGCTGEDNKPFCYLVCVKKRCVIDVLLCLCTHILSNALKLGMETRKEHRGDTLQVMCQPKADLK
eukprot:12255428-Ditylum_brightwellii.AAC.1